MTSLALFAGLAVLHTWPLASAPGVLSRNDVGDTVLHEWIMAWVAHQVVTDPLHLFDANIFHPERYTLAYSDSKDALQLAGWYVLQSLSGVYLMVFTAISIVAATAARPRDWLGSRLTVVAPKAALAVAVAMAALTPFLLPYLAVSREAGLTRSIEETARYSAKFGDYLAAAGHVHFNAWSRRFWEGDGLFPGVTATTLALVVIAFGVAFEDRRARMVLAIGLAAFALSFGPAFPPYR